MYEQRIHVYPENTTLMTEIEPTGVQLKPETYIMHIELFIATDSSSCIYIGRPQVGSVTWEQSPCSVHLQITFDLCTQLLLFSLMDETIA